MRHKEILDQRFEVNEGNKGWVALETHDGAQLPGYRTKRIAKIVAEDEFYFTIGATKLGRRNGLSQKLCGIVREQGLGVIEGQSTAGSPRPKKTYVGFRLSECSEEGLRRILAQAQTAIEESK